MTSRMASLEASSTINSSDLAASSNSPKKLAQGEVKFQQVLASTREKTRKEPSNSTDDSNSKTSKDSKDSKVATSNQKPQAAKTKTDANVTSTSNIDKASRSEDQKTELESLNASEEIEREVVQTTNNVNEQVAAILTPQINATEVAQDFDVVVPNIDAKLIDSDNEVDVDTTEVTAENAINVDIDNQASASVTGTINVETSDKNLRDLNVDVPQVQTAPATLSKASNSLLEDSSEIDNQAESVSTVKEVAQEISASEERAVNVIVPANLRETQISEQKDASRDLNLTSSQMNLTRPEAPKNVSANQESDDTYASDADMQENAAAFGSAQNAQGDSRTSKSSGTLNLTQNIFNQSEDLLPQEFGAFDEDGSNDFDNLFSKMDSFVSVNDGKLSIDFKEIAKLPEENIPHRADQISMAVKSAVGRGVSEISLRMYPEDLGAVDVKIEFSEVGKVQSIKFFATKESTLELLQKDYSILERSLKEVINAEDASLSFNLKDGRGEGSEYQPQENFGLNNISEGNNGSERIITASYQATLQIQEDDQVDITV